MGMLHYLCPVLVRIESAGGAGKIRWIQSNLDIKTTFGRGQKWFLRWSLYQGGQIARPQLSDSDSNFRNWNCTSLLCTGPSRTTLELIEA